jgi:thiamine transport system ATP-binding protein
VTLARVLVRKRKILLLDEAFAALGPALRAELIGLVRNLVRDNNMHALLVSHQPRDALLASARTAFICAGKVIALEQTGILLEHSQLPEVRDYLGSI